LAQFAFEMCVAARNREKFTKPPILGVQGRSMSSMLILFKKPVTSACYDKQHVSVILQLFYTKRANSGKTKTFYGVPFFHASV